MSQTKNNIKSMSYAFKLCGLCAVFLIQSSCGGGSSEEEIGVEDVAIAYIKRPTPRDQQGNIASNDLRVPITFTAGGDLYLQARATTTSSVINVTGRITNGRGDVQGVSVSYDATKLVFSVRLEDLTPNNNDVPSWNLYEYDIPSDTLTQLTSPDITPNNALKDDISPSYLPSGDIIFSSNRQSISGPLRGNELRSTSAATDENRQNPAFLLHVREKDTGDITQVSFNASHDLDASVLNTGRVLFSRWNHMGGNNSVSLYSMNPDGSDIKSYYGAHSNNTGQNPATRVHFTKARELDDGRIIAIMRPFVTNFGGGDIVLIDAKNFADNTQPTWEQLNVASGTAQTVFRQNINNASGIARGGRYNAIFPMLDGSNRYLMSWSECRILGANSVATPCSFYSDAQLNDPTVTEAPPAYGIYVVDSNVQSLLIRPQNDTVFSEIAMAYTRKVPKIINMSTVHDSDLAANGIGVLHIRSVYDFEKRFDSYSANLGDVKDPNDIDGTDTAINTPLEIANAKNTTADERPARFIRIIKNAFITMDTQPAISSFTADPNNPTQGNTTQGMREIIGYAPIEPDGSVKIKIPANVPLSLSILDKDGRRISQRHQSWFQVKPGETLECVGCHTHNANQADNRPHSRTDKTHSINQGAPGEPYTFPNSLNTLWAQYKETMAEARTRHDSNAMKPSTDLIYDDVWTDESNTAANRSADASFAISYIDAPVSPVNPACGNNYDNTTTGYTYCRIVINYIDHIQPIWEKVRAPAPNDKCTSCHENVENTKLAAGQLDLTRSTSDINGGHFTSYPELFVRDQKRDANGLDLPSTIPEDQLILDANGNTIDVNPMDGTPDFITVQVPNPAIEFVAPSMSVNGALASIKFMELMTGKELDNDITNTPLDTQGHSTMLTASELKLISEWLDIGAQYYNNPMAAP